MLLTGPKKFKFLNLFSKYNLFLLKYGPIKKIKSLWSDLLVTILANNSVKLFGSVPPKVTSVSKSILRLSFSWIFLVRTYSMPNNNLVLNLWSCFGMVSKDEKKEG